MSRLLRPVGFFKLIAAVALCAFVLSGCADIDVSGRITAPVVPEGSATGLDAKGGSKGVDTERAVPENLAFVDSQDPISPMTEVVPDRTPAGPVSTASKIAATTNNVRMLGSETVEFGYQSPLAVPVGERISFTSGGWDPGASVVVRLRPGQVDLGTFTATSAGTAFGFIEIPSDVDFTTARLQWVSTLSGVRQTDTINVVNSNVVNSNIVNAAVTDPGASAAVADADKAAAIGTVCLKLADIEAANASIEGVLAGDGVNTDEDPLFWWPQFQAGVRAVGPDIDALRQSFLDAAEIAPEPLASDIRAADRDDRQLLDGLLGIIQESADVDAFESSLDAYRSSPEIVALETAHRIFSVDAFTSAECGFEMVSFKS